MSLKDLIEWAVRNGIDIDATIEVGDSLHGLGPLTEAMLDKRGDRGLDISTDN